MSTWYEPKEEDIEASDDGKDIDMYLGHDHGGSIYASVKVDVIKKILVKLEDKKTMREVKIDDAFVERVGDVVGMGHGAWDMVNPIEICMAVIKILEEESKK